MKPSDMPSNKYDLFAAAYDEEQKDGDRFSVYIEAIINNGWRQQYDMWCQNIRE